MMDRIIPKKNYIILGIIVIITFFLIYYLYMWYYAYLETKLNKPVLDKYMDVINYNEVDDYLLERSNVILYVSKLEDSSIREFEIKFKSLLKSDLMDRDILYMDITNNEDELSKIVTKYSNGIIGNVDLPIILVIENGQIKSHFDIKENNYDIELVRLFIQSIKFLEEDEFNG